MITKISSTNKDYSNKKSFGIGYKSDVFYEMMRTGKLNLLGSDTIQYAAVRNIEDSKSIEFGFIKDKKMNKQNPGFFIKCISHPKISEFDDESIFTYLLKMFKYSIKNQIGKSKSVNLDSVDKSSQLMELIQEAEKDLDKKMKPKKTK